MSLMKTFGIILMVIGGGFFGGCGGLLSLFFRRDYLIKLNQYKKSRAEGKKPDSHLFNIYIAHLSIVIGVPMMVFGLFIWLIGKGLEN